MKSVFITPFLSLMFIFLFGTSSFGQIGIVLDSTTTKSVIDAPPSAEVRPNPLIPGQYVVGINENERTRSTAHSKRQQLMRQKADGIVNRRDISASKMRHVNGNSIKGFPILKHCEENVDKLREDMQVKYIEQDQRLSINESVYKHDTGARKNFQKPHTSNNTHASRSVPCQIIYVNNTATGLNDGSSWTDAYTDLQSALANTCSGFLEIWVASGIYKPTSTTDRTISFVMENNVSVYGGFDGTETEFRQRNWVANVTTLSGDIGAIGTHTDNSYSVVFGSGTDNTALLEGFFITRGNANGSGDVLNPQRCGGGMYSSGGSAIVRNCVFVENTSEFSGGGMYNLFSSAPRVINCYFAGNTSGEGGGMSNIALSSPHLINCVFIGNHSLGIGGGMYNFNESDPILTNCSFSGNTANQGAAMFNTLNAEVQMVNGIVWGNGAPAISNTNGGTLDVMNSIVLGGYSPCVACPNGNGNVDPLFVLQPPVSLGVSGDLRLQVGSPAIDAGDTTSAPGYDFDRKLRPIGLADDIGAFEHGLNCPDGHILYVDHNASGAYNGYSWADAYTDLQNALANSCPNVDEIWVASGTYKPTRGTNRLATFSMKNNVKIYGGFIGTEADSFDLSLRDFSANPTILSGDIGTAGNNADNSLHVIRNNDLDSTAILDGFSTQWGNANVTAESNGGGMHNSASSPTISNCTFSWNNVLNWGGGMFNAGSSSPKLSHCTISNNTANIGGGMFNLASPVTLTNCTFSSNSAPFGGGGILNDGNPATLTNCTFFANNGDFGGAIYQDGSILTITGCNFSTNTAVTRGGGIYNDGSLASITDCTFSTNNSEAGGGIYNNEGLASITDCTFSSNNAIFGGGMVNDESLASITDCTFSTNNAEGGGGIYNNIYSPNITNCTFNQNSASVGGGGIYDNTNLGNAISNCYFTENSGGAIAFYGVTSSVTSCALSNCVFSENTNDLGGGAILSGSNGTLNYSNCIFYNNIAHNGSNLGTGGAYQSQQGQATSNFVNCLFDGNKALGTGDDGGGAIMVYEGDINLINTTIVNSMSVTHGGAISMFRDVDTVELKNSILWNNVAASDSAIFNGPNSLVTASYSLIKPATCPTNVTCGPGMILGQDPLFISESNLHLLSCSPVIDAGLDSVNLSLVDADSNSRKVDAIVGGPMIDLGAYERQAALTANRLYVNGNLSESKEGTSWDDAFNNLQEAMTYNCPGINEIWVSAGTYKPAAGTDRNASFVMKNNLAIYGGLAGSEAPTYDLSLRDFTTDTSTLSGEIGSAVITDNSYNVVIGSGTDSTAILDGFTITAGYGEIDNGVVNTPGRGAGMHNNAGSPNIAQCVFLENTALFGGGMYNVFSSNPSITSCSFIGNHQNNGGWGGGGIMNEGSSPVIRKCLFDGNIGFFGGSIYSDGGAPQIDGCVFKNNAGVYGGGITNLGGTTAKITNSLFINNVAGNGGGLANFNSNTAITNNTFYGNQANNLNGGGGIWNNAASPIITNCIVWGNTDGIQGPATPNVTYSLVQGGHAGVANLDVDPRFVDSLDLRPLPCSPAIDAGNNAANNSSQDINGNPRIFNATSSPTATIDMGAFEMSTDNTLPTMWTGLGDGVLWSDAANWDDGFIPQICRDIVIPSGTVTVPAGYEALGKTLDVLTGAQLITDPAGVMEIKN